MQSFTSILLSVYNMPEKFIGQISQIGCEQNISEGSNFIDAGSIPRKFALVISGLFRYVYLDSKGKEYTKGLIPEQRFISSYSAMITQTPSWFFIEALEDSTIFEINHDKWIQLRKEDPYWDRFLLKIVEFGFMVKEKRERELLLLDAETRYQNFRNDFLGMENRIKQHIIASFLGIKPESLSRIRKKSIS